MRVFETLPEGYREIYHVHLQKDKKMALYLNLASLAVAAVLCVPMHFWIPYTTLFNFEDGAGAVLAKMAVLVVSLILYTVLHELVHGVTMKYFGTKKVKYGFTGLYAFAGSDDYYDKLSYITIALAPVAVFFVVFGVLCALVPRDWFWVVYFLQVMNLSGAAGDAFVTLRFSKMPKDILVKDSGVGMTVYSKIG